MRSLFCRDQQTFQTARLMLSDLIIGIRFGVLFVPTVDRESTLKMMLSQPYFLVRPIRSFPLTEFTL